MVQVVLLVGRIVFLLVLYAFVFYVVRSINRDLSKALLLNPVIGDSPVPDRETRKALRRAAAAGELVGEDLSDRDWALIVRSAPRMSPGAAFPIVAGTNALVGRAPDCDLQLSDTFVSSHHASLQVTPEGLVVQDLGSTNGTFVNGAQVEGPLLLRPGDELAIGDGVFLVEAR